jgi:glycosyltransferase involved in cell wall biosynthesis
MRLSRARVARLNRLDRLLSVSRAAADALVAQGVAPDLLLVQPNGVDAEVEFSPDRQTGRSLREELGLPASAPLVGFVGQLVMRKDPLSFLRAFRRVAARRSDAHAVLIGARHSQKEEAVAYEASLHDEVRRAGLERRVHFLGERDDVPSVLAALSLLVNTSRQEPLGRVILEAMAMAVPVVATRVGGTPEIVADELNGLLVPPDAPAACAAAVLRLLELPELASRLGTSARAHVLSEFTPRACADGWRAVYDSLVRGRGQPW